MNQSQTNNDMFNYWQAVQRVFVILLYIAPLLFLAIYDFAFVTYDSEPDYVSAAFHIVEYGIPFISHHPGTLTQYLVSFPLLIGSYFELPFNITIILMRLTELTALAVFIVVSIHLMGATKRNIKLLCYILVWFFLFLYPSTSVLFRYISAEILLFGLSFVSCALWYKFLINEKNMALLGIVIAAGMNVKPTFIFLLIVLSSFHLLHYAYYSKTIKGVQLILGIFFYGLVWFVLFSIPKIFQIMSIMKNMIEGWLVLINKVINMFSIWHYSVILIVISLIVYLFYWCVRQEIFSKNKSNLINTSIREGWIIALPVAIFVFYKHYYYFIHPEIDYLIGLGQWESLGIMRRNSVPLYAFLVFIIVKIFIRKTSELGKYKPLLFSSLLLIIGAITTHVLATKDYMFQNNQVRLFDQSLLDLRKKFPNASVFIHHDNYFDSITQFQLWASIRYGNCNDKEMKTMMKLTYPEIDFSNLSYISAVNGIKKCDTNLSNNDSVSFYNRWLNVPDNVIKLGLCKGLNLATNKKIFLFDSRYIDFINSNEIINNLNLAIESCGYKIHKNRKYFSNNEILAFDIIRI